MLGGGKSDGGGGVLVIANAGFPSGIGGASGLAMPGGGGADGLAMPGGGGASACAMPGGGWAMRGGAGAGAKPDIGSLQRAKHDVALTNLSCGWATAGHAGGGQCWALPVNSRPP